MIFPQESHRRANIEDIAWSPFEEHMAVSLDTQMGMQVWRMADDFFFNEVELYDKLGMIKDSDLE